MRIVSLLPGATETVAALGQADALVGISHECDYPPEACGKPVLVTPGIRSDATSGLIDQEVRAALANGEPLYHLDEAAFHAARPDLVITQDLCDVCAVTPGGLQAALQRLAHHCEVLSLQPSTLADIFQDIARIACAVGREAKGRELIATHRQRLTTVRNLVRTTSTRPRVACLEWLDPPYIAGHWVPDMITAAGGINLLGASGAPSRPIDWSELVAASPDILILAPCGFSAQRTVNELRARPLPEECSRVPAVQQSQVFAVDAGAYFSRPGPRLIDGVQRLAALFHSDLRRELFPARSNSMPEALPPGVEGVSPLPRISHPL